MKKRNVNKKEFNEILFDIAFVILNSLVVAFFYHNILLTTILLSILTVITLVKWKSLRTVTLFFIGAFVGAGIEMICIYFGVWKYTITNFVNIPFWLFILWGNATALIYQGAKKIKEKRMKR